MTKTLIAAENQSNQRKKNRFSTSRRIRTQAVPAAPAQGSPEWRVLLGALAKPRGRAESLTIEETSREATYGDDLR